MHNPEQISQLLAHHCAVHLLGSIQHCMQSLGLLLNKYRLNNLRSYFKHERTRSFGSEGENGVEGLMVRSYRRLRRVGSINEVSPSSAGWRGHSEMGRSSRSFRTSYALTRPPCTTSFPSLSHPILSRGRKLSPGYRKKTRQRPYHRHGPTTPPICHRSLPAHILQSRLRLHLPRRTTSVYLLTMAAGDSRGPQPLLTK